MRCKPADLLSGWPTAAHAFASALCAAARSRAGQLSRAQWLKAATNVVRAAQRQRPSEGEHCGASEGTSVILILRQEVAQAGAEGASLSPALPGELGGGDEPLLLELPERGARTAGPGTVFWLMLPFLYAPGKETVANLLAAVPGALPLTVS